MQTFLRSIRLPRAARNALFLAMCGVTLAMYAVPFMMAH